MPRKKTAMEYAILLLGRRACSTAELRKKMLAREYSVPEIARVLEECTRRGFLNDRAYAESLAESVYLRGGGRNKAARKLQLKGIDREIIENTLAERETDGDDGSGSELSSALSALERRKALFEREPDPRKRREKALRFLAGRGFSAATAYEALNRIM